MADNFPPRPLPPNPPADFGPIVDAKVRAEQIEGSQEVMAARMKAEVKRINAHAQVAGVMAFMVVWFAFWFAAAIAIAGLRTAQYLWNYWPIPLT